MPEREADPDPFVGRELPSLRILSLLGRGAMGRVYAAEHPVLGRRVAIKILEPLFAGDPMVLARFIDEARAANSIRHPNIIDITDFGEIEGLPYYVMELLDGETLGARIARGRIEPLAAVRICVQVASALAAAHDRGVVHRDLKPDNIFLSNHPDYPDQVKVLDFGIAKLIDHGRVQHDSRRTHAGTVLGTPLYMSPEQSLGEEVDGRSDVYSLGVVLFEALTGTCPFERPTWTEVLWAQVHDAAPNLLDIDPTLPAALAAIVERALAKAPMQRFPDMRHMREALTGLEPQGTEPARAAQAGAAARGVAASATVPMLASARKRAESKRPPISSGVADAIKKIILKRIDADRLILPAMPRAAGAALAELSRPEPNLSKVCELIQQDPLIAPQLLRVARSAAYGVSRTPRTVQQAIMRMGMVRLRSVLLELSAHRAFQSPRKEVVDAFRGLWEHSITVAAVARQICSALRDPVDPDAVHVGGLLHDVGKPLVGVMLLEAEKVIGSEFRLGGETWIEVVSLTHRDVGVRLASKWQLGDDLQQIIADSGDYRDGDKAVGANIVCLANAVAKQAGKSVGKVNEEEIERLIVDGTERLGIDWRILHEIRSGIPEIAAAYELHDDVK